MIDAVVLQFVPQGVRREPAEGTAVGGAGALLGVDPHLDELQGACLQRGAVLLRSGPILLDKVVRSDTLDASRLGMLATSPWPKRWIDCVGLELSIIGGLAVPEQRVSGVSLACGHLVIHDTRGTCA